MHYFVAGTDEARYLARHIHRIHERNNMIVLSSPAHFMRSTRTRRFVEGDVVHVTSDPRVSQRSELMNLIYDLCDRSNFWPQFLWEDDETSRAVESSEDAFRQRSEINHVADLRRHREELLHYIRSRYESTIEDEAEFSLFGTPTREATSMPGVDPYTIHRIEDDNPDDWQWEVLLGEDFSPVYFTPPELSVISENARSLASASGRHQIACARTLFEAMSLGYVPRYRRQISASDRNSISRIVTDTEGLNRAFERLGAAAANTTNSIEVLLRSHTFFLETNPANSGSMRWRCSCGSHSSTWRTNEQNAWEGYVRHVRRMRARDAEQA